MRNKKSRKNIYLYSLLGTALTVSVLAPTLNQVVNQNKSTEVIEVKSENQMDPVDLIYSMIGNEFSNKNEAQVALNKLSNEDKKIIIDQFAGEESAKISNYRALITPKDDQWTIQFRWVPFAGQVIETIYFNVDNFEFYEKIELKYWTNEESVQTVKSIMHDYYLNSRQLQDALNGLQGYDRFYFKNYLVQEGSHAIRDYRALVVGQPGNYTIQFRFVPEKGYRFEKENSILLIENVDLKAEVNLELVNTYAAARSVEYFLKGEYANKLEVKNALDNLGYSERNFLMSELLVHGRSYVEDYKVLVAGKPGSYSIWFEFQAKDGYVLNSYKFLLKNINV